ADRAAAEERALRAAQHLDALEVQQLHLRAQRERVIDVVDIDSDTGFEGKVEVVLADAANEGRHRVAERGLRRTQRRVRDHVADLIGGREGAGLDVLCGYRRNRDRSVLQALLSVDRKSVV